MTQPIGEQLNSATLYERLGASSGIRRIVDGAVAAHMRNPEIQERFLPYEDRPERVEECNSLASIPTPIKSTT